MSDERTATRSRSDSDFDTPISQSDWKALVADDAELEATAENSISKPQTEERVTNSMRFVTAAVVVALASFAPAAAASAAAPRAGNQCKKREIGLVVGVLRCSAVAGPKYVWQRVTAKEPVAQPSATADCDPNYTPCVPIASDVDCSSGSGNGPAYVVGPVRVIGVDIYGLDHDGDGVGCERG